MISISPAENPWEQYPLWKPTDWTPRQRTMALGGLALLAIACELLAITLARWSLSIWLAADILIPLGLSLLCLGTTLVTAAFWYAYRHAANLSGSHAGRALASTWLLTTEGIAASLALALTLWNLIARVAPDATLNRWWDWSAISHDASSSAVSVTLLCNILMGAGLVGLTWQPQRNPLAHDSVLDVDVAGWRKWLRGIVADIGANSSLLMLTSLCLLGWFGFSTPRLLAITVLGAASLFFLVALAAEASRPHRAVPLPAE